jgi:hypothetical protein
MEELYTEAVTVSNAARSFDDLVEFDEMTDFVSRVTAAQDHLFETILSSVNDVVISAAAGGCKSAELLKFRGSDLFDDFSILFMLLGGADHERCSQLHHYGFSPLILKLKTHLYPFAVEHTWDKANHYNYVNLHWM